jgi:Cu-Zn family superoxide dismutase
MIRVLLYRLTANPQFHLSALVGEVTIRGSARGRGSEVEVLLVRSGLTPGEHGFHLHEYGDLGPTRKKGKVIVGGAAGAHWDPLNTGMHCGPGGGGHLGDLPVLTVDRRGNCHELFVLEYIEAHDFYGRSLIIHSGPDNYTDSPPNGGGRSREIGGVVR